MRRPIAFLIAVAALAPAVAPASADQRNPCTPRGSHTLAKSGDASVFRSQNGAFYGCYVPTGGRRLLATASLTIDPVRAAGPFVAFSRPAYHDGQHDEDVPATIASIGMCKGKGPRASKYASGTAGVRVTDMVLSREGDIAWIAEDAGGNRHVQKMDGQTSRSANGYASPITLSSGPGVDPESLTLRGSRLSWRQDDVAKTATLRKRISTCRA